MRLVEVLEASRRCDGVNTPCHPIRQESHARGFDEMLSVIGADANSTSTNTGLRVPPLAGVIFRMLCASVVLLPCDRLVGMRTGASIAGLFGPDGSFTQSPLYLEERDVCTYLWRFQDSFPITWTLTKEPNTNRGHGLGPFDQPSFLWRDSDTPACLYETAHFPGVKSIAGYMGLDGYTRPAMQGRAVRVEKTLLFPWDSNDFLALDYSDKVTTRWRLYADVLQTDPSARLKGAFSSFGAAIQSYPVKGMVPEELFLQLFPNNTRFRSVYGGLLYERG